MDYPGFKICTNKTNYVSFAPIITIYLLNAAIASSWVL
jgi:hypothetical protein